MIDFLAVGHVAQDVVSGGFAVGGTSAYASATARNLGRRPGIVTRLGPDFAWPEVLQGVELSRLPSRHTTTFRNLYTAGIRRQFLLSLADPIQCEDVPRRWCDAPIVLIGPVARELDCRLAEMFPKSLLGVTPQGWMREWNETGLVSIRRWEEAADVLPLTDVLVLSEEDLNGQMSLIEDYARMTRIAVMTQGPRGCTVFADGKPRVIPGFAAHEVDPTGAGDVFAAAFLIRLHETADPFEAARFANATASFCVEAPGMSAIPSREQVEARLRSSTPKS